jgi:glycosyltransferase involved in cell wall biosynthesis
MTSIIIPAHNEEAVIINNLMPLKRLMDHIEYQIIVVCNGCNDETALLVRKHFPRVTLLEIEQASKIAALNAGDALAKGDIRIYVDADISLTSEDVMLCVSELARDSSPRAAAPRMRVDTGNASLAVKWYYRLWTQLPYVTDGLIGGGFYAMNRRGRKRFDKFPDIIADDEFVRLHFSNEERKTIQEASFTIIPPGNLKELIRVKTRVWVGNYQLQQMFPQLHASDNKSFKSFFLKLLFRPDLWVCLLIYIYAQKRIRSAARKRLNQADMRWERDNSSRLVG